MKWHPSWLPRRESGSSEPNYVWHHWPIKIRWNWFSHNTFFRWHGVHQGYVRAKDVYGRLSYAKVFFWVFHFGPIKVIFGQQRRLP
jgi:hypothetical protein